MATPRHCHGHWQTRGPQASPVRPGSAESLRLSVRGRLGLAAGVAAAQAPLTRNLNVTVLVAATVAATEIRSTKGYRGNFKLRIFRGRAVTFGSIGMHVTLACQYFGGFSTISNFFLKFSYQQQRGLKLRFRSGFWGFVSWFVRWIRTTAGASSSLAPLSPHRGSRDA